MLLDIFWTLILVFLNGFFVAAEFALVKVRASQLEIKASAGNHTARSALNMLKTLDAYLSASQLGITLASLGLGWIGESVVTRIILNFMNILGIDISTNLVHTIAIAVAFTLITIMHIVFAEQAPKTMAIQKAETFTLAVAYPLKAFYIVFKPFIWMLNALSNLFLKILGFPNRNKLETHSSEELQFLLDQGKVSGALEPTEHELIKNVFNFNLITARQIMTPRTSIKGIDYELSHEEIIDTIISEGYSRMPVYKESTDNIIGIVYTKDILKMINQKNKVDFNDAIRPPYFVPETKKISELLKELQAKHIHMAIIMDEFGGVAGIVTVEDIIEELVGEIQDEHDEEAPFVEKINDKEYVVNALSNIEDVNEYLPVPLPKSSEYETVAGLVNVAFDKIPDLNEKVMWGEYEITVLKKSKQSVLVVKLILKVSAATPLNH
jgi:CBS domain containing-hemolysin-like protein